MGDLHRSGKGRAVFGAHAATLRAIASDTASNEPRGWGRTAQTRDSDTTSISLVGFVAILSGVAGLLLVTFGPQRFREPRVPSPLVEVEEKMNMAKHQGASSRTILIGASDDNQ